MSNKPNSLFESLNGFYFTGFVGVNWIPKMLTVNKYMRCAPFSHFLQPIGFACTEGKRALPSFSLTNLTDCVKYNELIMNDKRKVVIQSDDSVARIQRQF